MEFSGEAEEEKEDERRQRKRITKLSLKQEDIVMAEESPLFHGIDFF